jgi:hypothetical protein
MAACNTFTNKSGNKSLSLYLDRDLRLFERNIMKIKVQKCLADCLEFIGLR